MFNSIQRQISAVFILSLLLLPLGLQADQFSKTQGEYTVHYNVFNSTFLSQDVAQQYKIKRSPKSFLLNVSVRKSHKDGSSSEQAAKVSGYTNDLMRHTKLKFREVKEKGAIYYLADIDVKYTETLKFHITAVPKGSKEFFEIEFHRKVRPDDQ